MTVQLNMLGQGQMARVTHLHASGEMRNRLLDLGFVPGTLIERIMSSAAGDPICYRVRGSMIALRAADAAQIVVDL